MQTLNCQLALIEVNSIQMRLVNIELTCMVTFVEVQAIVPAVSDLANARVIWSAFASATADSRAELVVVRL